MLTRSVEDYLKTIYRLQRKEAGVTTNALAAEMAVSPASASNMIKKLAQLRLVEHAPYRGVVLTATGEKVALEVIRHHRLLELYLSQALGVSLERVHQEADRLEHVLSEELEERIAASLGEPTHDPHGDPIPGRDGTVAEAHYPLLSDLRAGQGGTIVRVSDRNPEVLRDLAGAGLLPGTEVRVLQVAADGGLRVRTEGAEQDLSRRLADAVHVAASPAALTPDHAS
ncbi:MAG: metal-dependent transcriptional regulator [Armatimonadota bacterium]|nr:metal-dependent transcriptional regulator [Armatimonadota bacterium]MDR7452710.1 metal-dependent transcriptional regulator [Armatimonadota bacterium]MDR7465727.1 metal-dependent transcriptional regulator [Armatimonadota bacterium]MDR7493635.1 metal-dependent transcriptional regulator [Armatimonadota bacterium]MDR7499116.1 metal-dependent transcriptional regulator [Armatimonadota bacterium]